MDVSREQCETRVELIRLWSERLMRDYDHICFTYRQKLQRPVIKVDAMAGRWGVFDPETRTLVLSETLIDNYPWDAVLEILKHEMAHQIVFDQFGSDQAHGPLFHRACRMLGMAQWAMRAETDLQDCVPQSTDAPSAPEDERLLRRVEKLLALSASSNEHEAMSAMAKVREMQSRYQLERLRANRPADYLCLTLRLKKKRVERYQSVIASLLNEHFFVEVIHSRLYDAGHCCEYKTLELLGSRQNVKMAEYVFYFLSNQLPMLWRDFQQGGNRGRVSQSSYYLGVLHGFGEKLEVQSKRASEGTEEIESRALLAVGDKELSEFVRNRFPKLTNVGRGRRRHDAYAYAAGQAAGARLKLHRGIESRSDSGKFLTS